MIEVSNLHKSFGTDNVLCGASFSLAPGTIAALVGSNGSGKTTTLHALAGLCTADAGTIRVDGEDVTENRRGAQERLAFLPQEVRFHESLTPRQVLQFYAGFRHRLPARIEDLLGRVDLLGVADRPSRTLSGGMRQRLGLALLELADAPVLLLDEPALSLDPEWRQFLMKRLRGRAEEGATVLLATHLLEVWSPLADRVLRCEDGKIEDAAMDIDPVSGTIAR